MHSAISVWLANWMNYVKIIINYILAQSKQIVGCQMEMT